MVQNITRKVFSWNSDCGGSTLYPCQSPAIGIRTTYTLDGVVLSSNCSKDVANLKLFWNLKGLSSEKWSSLSFDVVSQEYRLELPIDQGVSKIYYAIAFQRNDGNETKPAWLWTNGTEAADDLFAVPPNSEVLAMDVRPTVETYGTLKTLSNLTFAQLFPCASDSLYVSPIGPSLFRVTGLATANPSRSSERLGKAISSQKYIAQVRSDANWLQPRTGYGDVNLDKPSVAISLLRKDGIHVVVVGLSGSKNNCTSYITSTEDGGLALESQNDSDVDQKDGIDAIIGYGTNADVVFKSIFQASREAVLQQYQTPPNKPVSAAANTSLFWDPSWFDGLMYCTWNGLGSHLTHANVVFALQELHDQGIRISGVIIDDGWQSTRGNRMLYDLEAREGDFPAGLKGLITEIREKFSYIENIGVWSTIVGYWNGFEPGSKVEKMFDCIKVPFNSPGETILIPAKTEVRKFYSTYFSFLKDAGVTCLKIDNQSTLDKIRDPKIRGELWQTYQDELWDAAVTYFDGRIIYCMAMVPNIMLYSLQRTVSPGYTPVFRNSDDFFPNEVSSHYWHIYCNFYNSIYTRNLQALPDYDMFQTLMHPDDNNFLYQRFPKLHAAARALSGGPIYFTDTPKIHDIGLIEQLSGKDSTGRHMVVRFDDIALPSDIYRPFHSDGLLRVTNYYGNSIGVLGLFNFIHQTVVGNVTISDFRIAGNGAAPAADTYAFRSYNSGEVWHGANPGNVVLEPGEAEIITAAPVIHIPKTCEAKLAIFGVISCMSGAAAMDSYEVGVREDGILLTVYLKIYGTLGIFANFPLTDNVAASTMITDSLLKINVNEKNSSIASLGNSRGLIKVEIFLPTDKICI